MSFVVMERLGITEALALDSDFSHRFIALAGAEIALVVLVQP